MVNGKVAAKATETQDNTNCKTTGEENEEEQEVKVRKSSTLCQFLEDSLTSVPDKFINPQLASKGVREMFKELQSLVAKEEPKY